MNPPRAVHALHTTSSGVTVMHFGDGRVLLTTPGDEKRRPETMLLEPVEWRELLQYACTEALANPTT